MSGTLLSVRLAAARNTRWFRMGNRRCFSFEHNDLFVESRVLH